MTPVHTLTREEGRQALLAAVGPSIEPAPDGVTELVDRLRHVQLDPIDRIGTNADLVAMARMDGVGRGDVHRAHGFEHFAKERCLLPARAFPYYRDQAVQTPWWRNTERMKRVDPGLLDAVRAEVHGRGPLTPAELSDHGQVEPLDWHGWKSSSKAGTLALEVLWTRCEVVVIGRQRGQRIYDVPSRALPDMADVRPDGPFARWAVGERVSAAGLLSTAGGPWWSMIGSARTDGTVDDLIAEGALQRVRIEGSRREWLVEPDALERTPVLDERLRILGPLDPLLWNRALVEQVFGFTYLWEVYKPAEQRRWGWYVCPLLHRDALVGRIEARTDGGTLVVDRIWREADPFPEHALRAALERHAQALGCDAVAGMAA